MSAFWSDADDTWERLSDLRRIGLGIDAGLATTDAQWQRRGVDPERLGLLDLGPAMVAGLLSGTPPEIPVFPELVFDLQHPGAVRIVHVPPGEVIDDPELIAAGWLDGDPPPEWLDDLARDYRGLLVIAPERATAHASYVEWQQTWRVAVLGVARHLGPAGVGIT